MPPPVPSLRLRAARAFLPAASLLLYSACFFPATVLNERTSVEQELTTYALERAIAKLDLEALPLAEPLHLRISGAAGIDIVYLRALLERRLRGLGITLVENDPQSTLHVIVPLSGSDMTTTIFGFPLGAAMQGVPSSDISVYRKDTQHGRARVQAELLDQRGLLLDEVPEVTEVVSIAGQTYLMVFGPFRSSEPDDWIYSERSAPWQRIGSSVREPR